MIQCVECFRAKLQRSFLVQPGCLRNRNIEVVEARSDDDVSTEISEACSCREHGRVEPGIRLSYNSHFSCNVWPDCICNAIDRTAARDDVDGIAALHLRHQTKLPSFHRMIAAKRQFIDSA